MTATSTASPASHSSPRRSSAQARRCGSGRAARRRCVAPRASATAGWHRLLAVGRIPRAAADRRGRPAGGGARTGRACREPAALAIGERVYIAVEDTEHRARKRLTPILDGMYDAPGLTERVAVCGPPEACAEQLRDLAGAGARELLLHPMYGYPEQLEALATVAELVRDD
jgi:hypothetical protein